MALLAETLIDEWLNRRHFLTMRGIRNAGVDEIDLLGVKPTPTGLEGWHVEAQISFRPVGYISKLPDAHCKEHNRKSTSAFSRSPDLLRESVKDWVAKKFTSSKKEKARNTVWPGLTWKFVFIHAVVKEPQELELIQESGVEVIPFSEVLTYLSEKSEITGAAGTDITEIVHYFARYSRM